MISKRFKSNLIRFMFVGIFILMLLPLYMYFSFDVEKLKTQYPHAIIENNKVKEFTISPQRPKKWTSLTGISKFSKWAIVLSEDWGFYQHEGVDIEQVKAALSDMVVQWKFRGASTITQQMVKNVYLSEARTIWRKIHELILAQKVEKVLSKRQILEIYLNCIEYGPGIYGIYDASFHYFKKHPSALNAKEGAFLAMLLPSPKRYYVSFKNKKLSAFAETRIATILNKMKMAKIISSEDFERYKKMKFSWEKN